MKPIQEQIPIAAFCEEIGSPIPFIPKRFEPELMQLGEGVYATRDAVANPYDLNLYLYELLSREVEDYFVFAFGGHGVSSRAIHYYCVSGDLALFFQLSFGNVFRDRAAQYDRIEGMFLTAELLYRNAQRDAASEKRLLVVQSDMYGSGWCRIEGHPKKIDPKIWHTDENY